MKKCMILSKIKFSAFKNQIVKFPVQEIKFDRQPISFVIRRQPNNVRTLTNSSAADI